ncbi:MAG: hypothetical protein M5U26_08500 [Planctomycetota bacterium]|nr:hypothetical protein [Planctomycetota bacterium]
MALLLEVVCRCFDGGNVHNYAPRIVGASVPKAVVVRRCVRSLVESLKGIEHKLVLIERVADPELRAWLHGLGAEIVPGLEGNNPSWLQAVERCRLSTARWVYQPEDDYLHAPNAVRAMLDFAELAVKKGVERLALHPYDDADNYKSDCLEASKIVPGPERHWRRNTYSTAVVFTRPWVFAMPEFEELASLYETPEGRARGIHEGNTINKLWRDDGPLGVRLFTPLPSLAVALNENEPPLFDWKARWEACA